MSWQKEFFINLNLYEGVLAKSLIWLIFLIFAFLVIFFALIIVKALTEITNRFKINKVIAGSFILGIITSVPELTISVASSITGFPQNSFNNILGANLFYVFNFSFFMLFFSYKYKSLVKSKNSVGSIIFTFFVLIILFLTFLPNGGGVTNSSSLLVFLTYTIPKVNISLIILLFFIIYVIYSVYSIVVSMRIANKDGSLETYVYSPQQYKKWIDQKISNLKKVSLIVIFVICSILLIVFSFCLSMVVDVVPHVYGIPETSVSGLFLSFVTNTPELVSSIVLFKTKEFDIVKGNFQGTLAFNLIIPFFSDISFTNGGLLSFMTMHSSEVNETYSSLEYLQVFSLITLLLIMFTPINIIEKIKNQKLITSIYCSEMIMYVVGWSVILSVIR